MDRRIILAANWKMHKTREEAVAFVEGLVKKIPEGNREVFLAVPYTLLQSISEKTQGTRIVVGAQNMSDASEGAFTGEIAAKMLLDVGARFVIVGHSERRQLFHESNEWIQKKVVRALQDDLPPLLCIGENLEERQEGRTEEIVRSQILDCLASVERQDIEKVILAYEPVWAIGTGMAATPEMAQETQAFCRKVIDEQWGEAISKRIPILYGGSAKPDNAKVLMEQPDVDGLLVGGASLSLASFSQIVNY